MPPTIQDIFQQHFAEYAREHNLPLHYHKLAQHIIDCRTAKLGGHSLYCENGHLDGIWYNSCKHRCCPQCNGTGQIRWVEKQKNHLLDCPHIHITFTIPQEYRIYWQLNTSLMMDILFKAVKETLTKLLIDDPEKKYLDAIPGFILALHTWGRNLILHPHIHCIITHGGLNTEQQWVKHKRHSLLPAKVLMLIFRGKFNDFLRQTAKNNPDWTSPQGSRYQQLLNLTNKMGRKKWNVFIKPEFKKTGPLLNYLVNYMKGGPLKNCQIQHINKDKVQIRYYPHKKNPDGKKTHYELMTLTYEQFFQRYLQHIPPFRKPTIRQYGLYANGSREKLNQARQKLGQNPIKPSSKAQKQTDFMNWDDCLQTLPNVNIHKTCRICHRPLTVRVELPRYNKNHPSQAPPASKRCA